MIVDIARLPGHHHFVLEPGQIRQPLHLFGIRASDAGRGGMRQSRGASCRDDAPFGLGQFGQPPAHSVHQLVHIHVEVRGLFHRFLHFGQRLRPGDDGVRALTVDHRPDADALVDVGFGSRRAQDREPANQARQETLACRAEQLPPIADESVFHSNPSPCYNHI